MSTFAQSSSCRNKRNSANASSYACLPSKAHAFDSLSLSMIQHMGIGFDSQQAIPESEA